MTVKVKVRCVACQAEREIGADEVPRDEVPMCDLCFSPMVAVGASVGVATKALSFFPDPALPGDAATEEQTP